MPVDGGTLALEERYKIQVSERDVREEEGEEEEDGG